MRILINSKSLSAEFTLFISKLAQHLVALSHTIYVDERMKTHVVVDPNLLFWNTQSALFAANSEGSIQEAIDFIICLGGN